MQRDRPEEMEEYCTTETIRRHSGEEVQCFNLQELSRLNADNCKEWSAGNNIISDAVNDDD